MLYNNRLHILHIIALHYILHQHVVEMGRKYQVSKQTRRAEVSGETG